MFPDRKRNLFLHWETFPDQEILIFPNQEKISSSGMKKLRIRFAQWQFHKNYLTWNTMFSKRSPKLFTEGIH